MSPLHGLLFPIRVRSQSLTRSFRASCHSARLSRAQVPAFANSSVLCRTFQLVAKDILYAPSHKQCSPYDGVYYTSCGALAETRNGCTRRDHSTDPSHLYGARSSSVVRAFAHGVMGQRIDPSWWTLDWFNKGCGILSVG